MIIINEPVRNEASAMTFRHASESVLPSMVAGMLTPEGN
jgi:hypothetical protein